MSKITAFAAKLPDYWKTIMAAAPVVLFVGTEVVQAIANGAKDGSLDSKDVYTIVVAAGTAVAVFLKRNRTAPAESD